ncbi:flavoprotein [Lucifera butyrica]|uniref:Flavoprotein n=1 Tax=Lucifera butyrica TaxID=1351585 RepID=A0A498R1J2_9FIRM|nr:flavoprotein [Lucifera butyrica]VBB05304.1 flavoprotein [Lucifera butyrica]
MEQETLVRRITAEVMRRLEQKANPDPKCPGRKIMAVVTGGTIGLEAGMVAMQELQSLPSQLSVILSPAAEKIVGSERIRNFLGQDIAILTAQDPYPGKMLREADLVIVPVLTQNTAAKLAYTLADTLPSILIIQALMFGKPVIAARNAADPRDEWRVRNGMGQGPAGLTRVLQENLNRIEGLGIQLVPIEQLAQRAQELLLPKVKPENQRLVRNGKRTLVDAAAIRLAAQTGAAEYQAPTGALITPLAWDEAREYGIEIVAKEQSYESIY